MTIVIGAGGLIAALSKLYPAARDGNDINSNGSFPATDGKGCPECGAYGMPTNHGGGCRYTGTFLSSGEKTED